MSRGQSSAPDTAGVLGHWFAIELINWIWQFLPFCDLIAYGNTSGVNRVHVQDFLRRSTNDEIRPFFDHPQALQNMLWQTHSLVSGSVALAALLPPRLRTWDPQDMDIYTTKRSFSKVLTHVLAGGYTIIGERTANPKYPGNTSIAQVVNLSNRKGRHLDIIVGNTKSALTLIFEYYGSHVVNCITGRGLYSAYPYHTLANRVLINASIVTAHYFALTDEIHRCMIKYTIRGFTFQTNPLIYLATPHRCKEASYCPHTVRDIFDRGGVAIAYNNTTAPVGFIRNNMQRIWRGRFLNVWAFGGDSCDVNATPAVTTDAFLLEIPR